MRVIIQISELIYLIFHILYYPEIFAVTIELHFVTKKRILNRLISQICSTENFLFSTGQDNI